MQVVLLGTGSADGWPNPFCHCASCQAARAEGSTRAHTSALVDGRVLIDIGPDVPRSAVRAGCSLRDVDLLLLTHAHPDHVHGLALLARQWAQVIGPLAVAGPASALAEVEHWVQPDGPVTLHALGAGDELTHDGYVVRALGASHDADVLGEALLYDVTGTDGARLLHATDTGPVDAAFLEAVEDRSYDVVLLEETFGDVTDHGTDHLDLVSFPTQLAQLRTQRAVTEATYVVAVHLSHHNPPPDELRRRLAAWDAHVVEDGAVIDTSQRRTSAPPPQRTLVTGGARSGKSRLAEQLLADRDDVLYVATAVADDDEMRARVEHHQQRRPGTWRTKETRDVAGVLRAADPGDTVLVDCLTLWLAGVLDEVGAWGDDAGGDEGLVAGRVDDLVDAWRSTRARVVAVTNEVGSGVVPATASGRRFRDLQGRLNAAVAAQSDAVLLVVAGQVVSLRGAAATVSP